MNEDIFDKIMKIPILNIFSPFYKKHKEGLLYLFFGGLTFFLSIGSYIVLNLSIGLNELIANIFSWILSVLFAYFTNRTWVFQNKATTFPAACKEIISFFGGRVFTLIIEEILLLIFITILGLNSVIIKIIAQVVVIVLNYIISKWFVFN